MHKDSSGQPITRLELDDVEPPATDETALDLLLANDSIQNSLLQNYRQTEIYLQTLLLAVAAGSLAVLVSLKSWWYWAAVILSGLMALSLVIMLFFRKIVRGRAATVSHIHRRIVLTEHSLPLADRSITLQKLFQQRESVSAEVASVMTSIQAVEPHRVRQAASKLVESGFVHTRNVIGRLIVAAFGGAWVAMLLVAVAVLLNRQ
jgi:hypothetical protein